MHRSVHPLAILAGLAALAALTAGCDDLGPGPLHDPSVDIVPSAVTVEVGSGLPLEVEAIDSTGARVLASELTWTSSSGDVALVDSTGTVWGRGSGNTIVVARLGGPAGPADSVRVESVFSPAVEGSQIVTGRVHSCALDRQGTAYCWGDDRFGQLGNGDVPTGPGQWPTPVRVASDIRFTALAAGPDHTCGLASDQRAYCWGDNEWGQLGNGTVEQRAIPVRVSSEMAFVQITAGWQHTCGLTAAGDAFCWGRGVRGQLGTGGETDATAPQPVAGDLAFEQLSAGGWHTCGLTAAGEAYCWGQWRYYSSDYNPESTTPQRVMEDGRFTALAAGFLRTCGIGAGGSTRCIATGDQGAPAFRQLTLGRTHSCGLTPDGVAYCWGSNERGELGDGTRTDRRAPTRVNTEQRFMQLNVSPGAEHFSRFSHTCGVTQAGAVYCWGAGHEGQLGTGVAAYATTPVAAESGLEFEMVVAHRDHSCGLVPSGRAYCWGANRYGQLGDGTTTPSAVPVPVQGALRFRTLTAGAESTCGLTLAGEAYCWGRNQDGQLGDGTTTDRVVPGPIQGDYVFEELDAGAVHVCGLASGRAYCWGGSAQGRLGNGQSGDWDDGNPVPGPVETELRFTTITAGYPHTCALTQDGRAYCWGANSHGELGNGEVRGTAPSRWLTPGPVSGDLRFTALTAGGTHTCGIATSGGTYCWGRNVEGQLGIGAGSGTRVHPTEVAGGLDYREISAGLYHTCAVTPEGRLFCWGENDQGRLGDGTQYVRPTPVEVALSGGSTVAVAPGDVHTCVAQEAGTVYCWGARGWGQLGDGVLPWRATPTAVAPPLSR